MIIDFHTHVLAEGWLPAATLDGFAPLYRRLIGESDLSDDTIREHFSRMYDPAGTRILSDMDAAGVERSVILPMDHGFDIGEPTVPMLRQNELTRELCDHSENRLLWFFGIDPRRARAAAAFEDALRAGAKGLKLYPPAGFYPHDPVCRPLFEVAVEHDVPVIAHCGPASPPLLSRFAHPLHWDEVAAAFPKLQIVLGHGGKIEAWAREAVAIAIFKPNIHIEISLWDGWLPQDELDDFLDFMRRRLGPDRILWGTDRFGMNEAERMVSWRTEIETLGERTAFSDDDVALLMGGNATRMLHLES